MYTVRRSQPADARACMELARDMHAGSKYAHVPFSPDRVMRLVNSLTRENVNAHGQVLLTEQGQIVGFTFATCTICFFAETNVVQELSVYVDPAHRSFQNVKMLIDGMETWAIERGAYCIYLGVNGPDDSTRVRQLYQFLGYTEWGPTLRKEF